MSLAVLARKTKTQQRLRSTKCGKKGGSRTVGFVLNMTGRGGGIGLSGMSYKQRGMNCRKTPTNMGLQGKINTGCLCEGCCEGGGRCKTGQAGTCCVGDQRVSKKCRDDCGLCWYGGMSQPAPQMSYRNYINRKANGAYRPGGKVCCSKFLKCQHIFDLYPIDKSVVIVQGSNDLFFSGMTGFNTLQGIQVTNPTNPSLTYTLNTFGKSDSSDIQAFFFYKWLGSNPRRYLYIKASPHIKSIILEDGSTIKLHHDYPYYPLDGNESYFERLLVGLFRPEGMQERVITTPCSVPTVTWKQHPDIAASTITEHRRQSTIRCANGLIKRNPVYLGKTLLSNRINAKPVCSWYNPVTCKYETVKRSNPLTQSAQCTKTLPIKSRLGYTRINKNWCNTTKTLTVGTSSSEQIAKRKQRAFLCPCGPKITSVKDVCENKLLIENCKRDKSRYCYPRPFHTDPKSRVCWRDQAIQQTLPPPPLPALA